MNKFFTLFITTLFVIVFSHTLGQETKAQMSVETILERVFQDSIFADRTLSYYNDGSVSQEEKSDLESLFNAMFDAEQLSCKSMDSDCSSVAALLTGGCLTNPSDCKEIVGYLKRGLDDREEYKATKESYQVELNEIFQNLILNNPKLKDWFISNYNKEDQQIEKLRNDLDETETAILTTMFNFFDHFSQDRAVTFKDMADDQNVEDENDIDNFISFGDSVNKEKFLAFGNTIEALYDQKEELKNELKASCHKKTEEIKYSMLDQWIQSLKNNS